LTKIFNVKLDKPADPKVQVMMEKNIHTKKTKVD